MNKKIFLMLSVLITAGLSGCGGMPKHAQSRVDEKPELVVVAAPLGAELIVDGRRVGVITDDEKQSFAITTGNHKVRVQKDGVELYSYEFFIQNSTRRVIDLSHPNR